MKEMPTILAIETATSMCSVALGHGGRIYARAEDGVNVHSNVVLTMVSSVFDEAGIVASDLDAVAVGQGPGSFTGLRIGVGVGQGIAYGASCPMIGISSLEALAHQAIEEMNSKLPIITGIDARMGEIYWSVYRESESQLVQVSELAVSAPDEIALAEPSYRLVGNAWASYWGLLNAKFTGSVEGEALNFAPKAQSVLALAKQRYRQGALVNPLEFSPVYVRDNVAKKSAKF